MTHHHLTPIDRHPSNSHRQRQLQCPKIGEQQPRRNNEIRQIVRDF